ncbi:hypothetical protein GIB67_021082 [Kingdonia uniflora]|uniref:Sugar phosphate transporter domain-containing protein n=1 Tax=Kingdonia uniflora TaxID=39325 RepID=A0A7J7N769_9MAGN|nr:hypothetical protein GIB67_021082 [Kingdonia uniflora]
MICSVKQSPSISLIPNRQNSIPISKLRVSIPNSLTKPLCLSFGSSSFLGVRAREKPLIECKAYEASDKSNAIDEETAKLKISVYFATWWALNVVFNIYNKKVLNAFPFPWLTSTLSLAAGSLMMLVSWVTRIAEPPETDMDFWKALFPVAVAHTIGHVAATVSMSKVAVSFTHIIKSGEPAFSVLVSRFFLGEAFPAGVYLSLLPIIGGCALAAVTELNFNMIGFMGAMISNLAFVFRNIFSKKGMKGKSVSGMNYYACLSMLSLLILTPFAIAVEGPQMWAAGWENAVSVIGTQFIWWVAAQSVFYHLYNQVSYMSLDQISPLTFSIGNTMKRISVIVASIIIFRTPVQPVNALGAAIAVLGTFLYSQMVTVGIVPDVFTFTITVMLIVNMVVCRAMEFINEMDCLGFEEVVSRVLKLLSERGITNVVTYTLFIKDEQAYGVLVDGYCRIGRMDDALRVRGELLSVGLKLNQVICNSLINKFCKLEQVHEVERVVRNMEVRVLQLDSYSYSTLVDAFCKEDRVSASNDTMHHIHLMLKRGVAPEEITCSTLLDGAFKMRDIEGVLTLWKTILARDSLKARLPSM